ncbi:DNA-3-methyladenine glycosylase [soil metagenome]
MPRFDPALYALPSLAFAEQLVGATLLFDGIGGIIVETEAYAPEEPASHSFAGPTPRSRVMFGPVGHAYVYRSYGLHWCLNIVCGPPGSAVLIRALQPTHGVDTMKENRGLHDPRKLCTGPGRLTQALGITAAQNGVSLEAPPFRLLAHDATSSPAPAIMCGPRIGISKAVDLPWRFGLAGSPYLSRPFQIVAKPKR